MSDCIVLTLLLGCSGGTQEALQQVQVLAQERSPSDQRYQPVEPDLGAALTSSGRMRDGPRDWIGIVQGDGA